MATIFDMYKAVQTEADQTPEVCPGHATQQGTAEYAASRVTAGTACPEHFRQLVLPDGETLTLSSLAMSIPRERYQEGGHTEACAIEAARAAWNVLDTSPSQSWNEELSGGEVLAALREEHGITREQVFVIAKAGYPSAILQQLLAGDFKIRPSDLERGCHCLHPEYLSASLYATLAHLRLRTVDALLLENVAEEQLPAIGQSQLTQRLRAAFTALEDLRAQGLLRWYGLSSNFGLWTDEGDRSFRDGLSLRHAVSIAQQVGGPAHGLRFVEVPVHAAQTALWHPAVTADESDDDSGGPYSEPLGKVAEELGVHIIGRDCQASNVLLLSNRLVTALESVAGQDSPISDPEAHLAQIARSSPYVACTLIEQHQSSNPEATLALSTLPPDPNFQESYTKLLDSFGQGHERINGPAQPFSLVQLRLRDESLVLDGSYELEAGPFKACH
ncbi:hypothetical protein WJX73_003640 [Symbiochloris irregularis]|uniref:YcaO domain-containing protein n=1 Tax=Symbiochloris irregularis TaxID=706552 RepID=A0AAW1P1K6_9CHLO